MLGWFVLFKAATKPNKQISSLATDQGDKTLDPRGVAKVVPWGAKMYAKEIEC